MEVGDTVAALLDTDVRLAVEQTAFLEADISARKSKNDVDLLYARKSTKWPTRSWIGRLKRMKNTRATVSQSELDRKRLLVRAG